MSPGQATSAIRILPYRAQWRDDFRRLNEAWLRRHFRIEPIDSEVLGDPERCILAAGGEVLFALEGECVVGTCALLPADTDAGSYELTKMAVEEGRHARGIGRQLLGAAIAAFRQRGGRELFLETNSALKPAIGLYESAGFVRQPARRQDSHYDRADVHMIWQATAC